jgi:hypothetical protein
LNFPEDETTGTNPVQSEESAGRNFYRGVQKTDLYQKVGPFLKPGPQKRERPGKPFYGPNFSK